MKGTHPPLARPLPSPPTCPESIITGPAAQDHALLRMTEREARAHFAALEEKLKGDIRSLPVADKLKLAGEMLEAGAAPSLARNVASLALAELDAQISAEDGQ